MTIPLTNPEIWEHLQFSQRFTERLPGDQSMNLSRRELLQACYANVKPSQVKAPTTLAVSKELAEQIGFTESLTSHQDFAHIFSGNTLLPGMNPFAMCYGGHQFGQWAGQLGDGRAINLGELCVPHHYTNINFTNSPASHQLLTLQLKGSGLTPFSRTADGLAVLRSSVREFLCSEAMYYLGVPTTRALSLISSGEEVLRDMFYDGHPKYEPGAIVCRVAPSFLRFGNFELFAIRQDHATLKSLANYCIETDFSHLLTKDHIDAEIYSAWFQDICDRTLDMIIHWMRVGFVHGVMNTDNMSILGLTIDYGPYGWIDHYDTNWTPNTTDASHRRYCFGNQPAIAQWNLMQLANALYPLTQDQKPLEAALGSFAKQYHERIFEMRLKKLGLTPDTENQQNLNTLISNLDKLLGSVETDMTLFYRQLAKIPLETLDLSHEESLLHYLTPALYSPKDITSRYLSKLCHWLTTYADALKSQQVTDEVRQDIMNQVNPKYVLRNYLAQQAISAAEQGDVNMILSLLEVLKNPYQDQPEQEIFAEKRPDWARHKPGCSMLSCSS